MSTSKLSNNNNNKKKKGAVNAFKKHFKTNITQLHESKHHNIDKIKLTCTSKVSFTIKYQAQRKEAKEDKTIQVHIEPTCQLMPVPLSQIKKKAVQWKGTAHFFYGRQLLHSSLGHNQPQD